MRSGISFVNREGPGRFITTCLAILTTTKVGTASCGFRREAMDWNHIEGMWKQAKGKVKEKWGQLTEDDLRFKYHQQAA